MTLAKMRRKGWRLKRRQWSTDTTTYVHRFGVVSFDDSRGRWYCYALGLAVSWNSLWHGLTYGTAKEAAEALEAVVDSFRGKPK